jgi:hypothetical protein
MTSVEQSATPPASPARKTAARPGKARPWWGYPGLVLTAVVIAAFLIEFVIPVYFTFDSAKARVPLTPGISYHYAILVTHVLFGTVAMVTGLFQLWPWLRQNHRVIHRWMGRLYVVSVILGAPALAELIVLRLRALGQAPPSSMTGFIVLAVLWVWTTGRGYLLARSRRFAEHRKMMIYSYAMTLSIIWSRFAFKAASHVHGFNFNWIGDNVGWGGWVVNLIVAQWWINRTSRQAVVVPAGSVPEPKQEVVVGA